MASLSDELRLCCRGRVLILGLGNPLFGDDGFGVRLAERLIAAGAPNVVAAGVSPERYLGSIREMDGVIFVDAVDAGTAPGTVVLLDADGMRARFRQVSTHKLSWGLLAQYVESCSGARAWLLGVQPMCTSPGSGLSEPVAAALEVLGTAMPAAMESGVGRSERP